MPTQGSRFGQPTQPTHLHGEDQTMTTMSQAFSEMNVTETLGGVPPAIGSIRGSRAQHVHGSRPSPAPIYCPIPGCPGFFFSHDDYQHHLDSAHIDQILQGPPASHIESRTSRRSRRRARRETSSLELEEEANIEKLAEPAPVPPQKRRHNPSNRQAQSQTRQPARQTGQLRTQQPRPSTEGPIRSEGEDSGSSSEAIYTCLSPHCKEAFQSAEELGRRVRRDH